MAGISQQKQTYSDTVIQKSEQGPCLTTGVQLYIERPKLIQVKNLKNFFLSNQKKRNAILVDTSS